MSTLASYERLITQTPTTPQSIDTRRGLISLARKEWAKEASTPCDRHWLTGCAECHPFPGDDAVVPGTSVNRTRDTNGACDYDRAPIVDSPKVTVHLTGWDTTGTSIDGRRR